MVSGVECGDNSVKSSLSFGRGYNLIFLLDYVLISGVYLVKKQSANLILPNLMPNLSRYRIPSKISGSTSHSSFRLDDQIAQLHAVV